MTDWKSSKSGDFRPLLPRRYTVDTSCYEDTSVGDKAAALVRLYLLFLTSKGFNLRALDGVTVTTDCRATALAIQLPPDHTSFPPDTYDPASALEMARTFGVRRKGDLKFHVALHKTAADMLMSEEEPLQLLAISCIAHEAAHIQYERLLYDTLPGIYGRPLECGERPRQIFMRAMDVWSEYAASRAAVVFRPQAILEHELILRRSIVKFVQGKIKQAPRSTEEIASPEMLIGAGYFLGDMVGLHLTLEAFPELQESFLQHSQISTAMTRLEQILEHLWETKGSWSSLDVFVPIYDLMEELG